MTVVEDRLVRDIEAVTQDIDLTESDLVAARAAVGRRLERRKQRDRRRTVLAAAAAALLIPAAGIVGLQAFDDDTQGAPPAGPAPTGQGSLDTEGFLTGEPPTPDRLDGVWRAVDLMGAGGSHLVVFSADGAVRFDTDGLVFHDPWAVGTYTIEGHRITMTLEGGRACTGQHQEARAALPDPGTLRLLFTYDTPSEHCSTERGKRLALQRVLPPSDAIAQLALPEEGTWGAPAYDSGVFGIWMPVGGGHLIDLQPDGSYAVIGDAGRTLDRGRWSRTSTTPRLVLTSASSSPTCAEGDRFELGELEHFLGIAPSLRGTVQRNDCGVASDADGWLRIDR